MPKSIGPYRIVRLIARGGMGEVYEAEQAAPVQRRVALKIIRAGMDSEDVLARFAAERRVLALMSHPQIATVYDAGSTAGGSPYVVMEYVDGVPLTEYVSQNNLGLSARLDLFLQVCSAVSHAHQKGIIHRDLKPNNILVTTLDGKAVPKVIDFGIAKVTQETLTQQTLQTSLGELVGTPEYMSPEQAAGTGLDVDTRADVYALGVLLYELLSGEHPLPLKELKGAGLEEILRLIRVGEPTRPSTLVKKLGRGRAIPVSGLLAGDLDWITLRALEKDRERRYDSVLDLAEDIQRHRRHEPVMAGPPSKLYRLKKFTRRNRLAVSFGVMMSIVLLAAIVAVAWQWRLAVDARGRALAEAQRTQRINTFLQDMLVAADPGGLGRDISVREVLDQTSATLEKGLEGDAGSRADAHHTLGATYRSLSLHEQGRVHLEQALALNRQLYGPDHEAIVEELLELSDSLLQLGEEVEAQRLALEGLKMQRRLVAEPDILVAKLMRGLARIELRLGSVAEAERLATGAVRQIEALVPAHERELGKALVTLADVHASRGEAVAGEALARRALEIHRRLLGEVHPDTLASMDRLAGILMRQGSQRNDEIEALRISVLERSRRVLGEDHSLVARANNNLALFLTMRQGKLVEAQRFQTEALRIWHLNFEGDHPHVGVGLINMGDIASEAGDLGQAQGYYKEAMEMGGRLTAEPVAMQARANLARVLHHSGQAQEALPLWESIMEFQESRIAPDSAVKIAYLNDSSCLILHLGRLDEAERLLMETVELLEQQSLVGDEFVGGLWYQQHLLGQLRAAQGRWQEAEVLLEESLDKMRTWSAWYGIRRHALSEGEKICRDAGRTELADAHAEVLTNMENSLESSRRELSALTTRP